MSKPWTEAEKLGLLFQIIEKAGSIPWDDLKLPDGRTKKACYVMIDKEKGKVRKAREFEVNCEGGENGEEGSGTPMAKTGSKRKATGDGEATPKKPKTPRKKKETVKAGSDGEEAAARDQAEERVVKPEPEEEGDVF